MPDDPMTLLVGFLQGAGAEYRFHPGALHRLLCPARVHQDEAHGRRQRSGGQEPRRNDHAGKSFRYPEAEATRTARLTNFARPELVEKNIAVGAP